MRKALITGEQKSLSMELERYLEVLKRYENPIDVRAALSIYFVLFG